MTYRSKLALLSVATLCCIALPPTRAHAQWWSARAPADFEECVERAEKTTGSKEAKASLVSDCDAKFAGRRKPGGGYTYYDFMQNRQFDLAGPNPTQAEQRHIDEQYTLFLDRQRRNIIAAAFTEKQRQQQKASAEIRSAPVAADKPTGSTAKKPPKPRAAKCVEHTFSCDFPRLSAGFKDLKKTLFGSSSSKTKRS